MIQWEVHSSSLELPQSLLEEWIPWPQALLCLLKPQELKWKAEQANLLYRLLFCSWCCCKVTEFIESKYFSRILEFKYMKFSLHKWKHPLHLKFLCYSLSNSIGITLEFENATLSTCKKWNCTIFTELESLQLVSQLKQNLLDSKHFFFGGFDFFFDKEFYRGKFLLSARLCSSFLIRNQSLTWLFLSCYSSACVHRILNE